jgi:hypothetical protein
MKYLLLICDEGGATCEEGAASGWVEEMDRRGVRLLGRELDVPGAAATVRVRDGDTLVTDGPFAETKEFVAGFDLLECSDLDEAIEVAARHPVSRSDAIEIRPFMDGLELGADASAFAQGETSGGTPYLLMMWMGGTPAADFDDQALMDEGEGWRRDLEDRGLQVFGNALEGPEAATTLRVRNGETMLTDGPFIETKEFVAGVDVVNCADREQAIALAAAHPIARYFAIEVRPFVSG